ncbi:MAG: FHA domain-containing protein [Pirellulales bacterium]|nr:FHA domain-containing protein [Pirellulales bacterium]
MYGELVPTGGGDTIPLKKKNVLIGRRESCDIVLRFPNVSAHHCQLTVNGGYWYVKDLQSRNGVKVNGARVTEKRLDPGDTLAVAKHVYTVEYAPMDLGAVGPPPNDDLKSNIFGRSLLERAGLAGKKGLAGLAGSVPLDKPENRRYDVMNDEAGQIKDPNRPM